MYRVEDDMISEERDRDDQRRLVWLGRDSLFEGCRQETKRQETHLLLRTDRSRRRSAIVVIIIMAIGKV